MCQNTVAMWKTASLQYLLITVKVPHRRKSLLVRRKILRLFVNTLTADDKHYLLNRKKLTPAIQMQLSQKQKTFFPFFLAFLKSVLIFKNLPKNDDFLMSFGNYRLRKRWLDKCLTSHASEHPSTNNMANGSKHCCNMNDSNFTIFINHCGRNYVGKSSF